MNNNEDKNLFDMYGSEPRDNNETSVDNTSVHVENANVNNTPVDVENTSVDNTPVDVNNVPNNDVSQEEFKPIPDSVMNQIADSDENISEEDLLKLYVLKNYDSIVAGGFSFPAFFFGMWYLFYRKDYKSFAIMIAIALVGVLALRWQVFIYVLTLLIDAAIVIYHAITFKKVYMEKARARVHEIFNMDISVSDKKKKVLLEGGVDNRVFLILIAYVFFSAMMNTSAFKDGLNNSKVTISNEVKFPIPEWAQNKLSDKSTDKYKKDKYEYIDEFVTYSDSKNECVIRTSVNNEYATVNGDVKARKYMEEVLNKDFAFTDVVSNKIPLLFYYDNEKDDYYYFYTSNKVMQLLKITIKKDKTLKCTKLKDAMIKNAKFVK